MKLTHNGKGFTLIEIIAVLIVLGILAAVAVPKYIDLRTDAATRALEGALAEGISTVSLNYASLMLSTGGSASTAALLTRVDANKPESADFTYTFSKTATGIKVKVDATADGALKGKGTAASKVWTLPSAS